MRALMRGAGLEPAEARAETACFVVAARIAITDTGPAEREPAPAAMDRFGRGRHPA